jgi:seryl-tRNA synthetase
MEPTFSEKSFPEIEEIKKRIEKIERHFEKEKDFEKKEEAVKKEIKEYLKEIQKTPTFSPPIKIRDEAEEIKKFSKTEQVGALVALALEKGLFYAVSVAKKLKNPAILDEFHDVLVDRYYEILIEKGILKKSYYE